MYEVVRFSQGNNGQRVIRTGMTLQEAQIARWHEKQKHWFYGYRSY